ncbi:MAG: hypothetical protein OXB89_06965, partial [Anaerolineaceae bacterium]|nr:hypothetical protein [Anaerolineaceae bacterium]
WRCRQADERQRPLHVLLVLWCATSLGFTLFANAHYTLAYYLPVLPAPCIALAMLIRHLASTFSRFGIAITAALLMLCILNLNAVWVIDQQINEDIRKGDLSSHAFSTGDFTVPLPWQLETAQHIRRVLDAGDASELILVFHVDYGDSATYLRWPFEFHMRGYPVRVLDSKQAHRLYPQEAALILWNEKESEFPAELLGDSQFLQKTGPFHLYLQKGNASPAPRTLLRDQPAYANGVRLIGYDALICKGDWTLHWAPGLADEESEPVHFFVHLLDGDSETLAQQDLRAYNPENWREGDRIVTTFNFGRELRTLPIETLRVGLYYFSDETNSYLRGINALDGQGHPVQYAIDIPHDVSCA